ncbi:Tkl protein kinase [Globisporangium polare]
MRSICTRPSLWALLAAIAAGSTHARQDDHERQLTQTANGSSSSSSTTTSAPSAGSTTSTNSSSSNSPQQQNWMLLAVISVAVLFVLVLGMVSFVLLRRRRKLKETEQLEYDIANDVTKVTQFTHGTLGTGGTGTGGYQAEFEYLPNDIRNDEEMQPFRLQQREVVRGRLIAKGGYGAVYKAKFRNETVVVKQLLPDKTRNKQILKSFMDEIRICAALDHPKVVRFIGITWSSLLDLSVVTEYMANGDLGSLLTEQLQRQASGAVSRFDYSWFKASSSTSGGGGAKCKSLLALDIAEALVYLHSFISPIIHRDLKSRNVLLSTDWEAKLTDFGVSRELDEDQTMTGEIGTVSWIAPEVLRGERYTEKADIYSFGVIMTELDTCRRPYSDGIPNEDNGGGSNQHTNTRIAVLVSNGKLKPAITDECPASVRQLIDQCLESDPKNRPSAVQIHFELRNLDMAEEERRETALFKRRTTTGGNGSGMRPTSSGSSLVAARASSRSKSGR